MFNVGDKVICIDAVQGDQRIDGTNLTKGKVYTIIEIQYDRVVVRNDLLEQSYYYPRRFKKHEGNYILKDGGNV